MPTRIIPIPDEWVLPGLSDTRDAINAIPAKDAPTRGSLKKGPTFHDLIEDHLTDMQQEILQLSATELVQQIKDGDLTASEVLEAFLPVTAWAHQATGCLSEFFPEEARQRAKELDEKQARNEQLGMLHGLPISIKGHITMEGHRGQNGFALDEEGMEVVEERIRAHKGKLPDDLLALIHKRALTTQPAQRDGVICKILRDQGAVFYCRTVMPQSVMQLDTHSNTYGQTINPHNLALSAGGSSGGEAALVSAKGGVLGVGTDIGGSVRQPCAVTGLWGLRPTVGRIPATSVTPPTMGNALVSSMSGPMCRFPDDMRLWMKAVLAGKPWETDPLIHRLPWREDVLPSTKRLKVGVLRHDGVAQPVAPIRRALDAIVEKLSSHVDLIEVDIGDLGARHWDLIRELYFPDGGQFTRAVAKLGNEDVVPLTEHIISQPQVRMHSQHETWDLTSRRDALKREYLEWVQTQEWDCLLTPACITASARPGTIKYWGYTSVFNLFDAPALVFPTALQTDAQLDSEYDAKHPVSDLSTWDKDARLEYEQHREVLDGVPIGLQVVGRRYEEEELLANMDQLRKYF
ncbi:unnamed protein product [Sympodiomycopsis kandeliae]